MTALQQVRFYIDESCIAPNIVLIALVAVDNLEYERFVAQKLEGKQKTRPYQSHGAVLHHTEDSMSIRYDMAAWVLRPAPLSVYFLIQHYDPQSMDEQGAKRWTYQNTFSKKILSNIIAKYRKLNPAVSVEVAFENLTDKLGADQQFFGACVAALGHPNVSTRVINKSNPLTALPDYMAGVLRACIEERAAGRGGTASATNLELVQEKIGLIAVCSKEGQCIFYERGEEVREFIEQGCPLGV